PDKDKSIEEGCIKTLTDDPEGMDYQRLECLCKHYKIKMNVPWKKLKRKEQEIILYGSDEIIHFSFASRSGNQYNKKDFYEGIINNLERRHMDTTSEWIREWLDHYMIEHTCETCHGARLNDQVLQVKLGKKNISEVTDMSIKELIKFFENLKLSKEKEEIARLVLKEILDRLHFLDNVGLSYLTLSRAAGTLSGGEAQRIRLATQIGSRLSGVLYVLDEPSIGLRQRDNEKLINSLLEMRDLGNTLVVVEHDTDTMLASDYLVDIGPGAGDKGGYVVAAGTPEEVMKNKDSITGQYLSGKLCVEVPKTRRKGLKKYLKIKGAKENNLKNIDVDIPLGTFTCVTGVSGSGKSSLVNEILVNALSKKIYNSKEKPGKHDKLLGTDNSDKIVAISQNPIGRTPRSNPATYTGVFDDIRELFTTTKEAKMHGFEKNRFSFNVKGGRCEACQGAGIIKIEMNFLPDVYVPCEVCHGTRYNTDTLNIKYKGKNIAEVLDMRVSEALEFFENVPKIKRKLQVIDEVGLGYIKLGQSAPTLSGGEAERVKLAKELQKISTGKTLYVLDEPTTGLHTDDIKRLLAILQKIVDNKNTVLVIEHNLDVIKTADYIIDLGPEGGDLGGTVVATGTPEEIAKVKESYTGQFLKKIL
ncbi:MAG: excinuclease ABC subunit UvrA, partial [Bacilli bacterium]|nr:excinuclease ABC subunit UvrA [Bacilli bacterium]